MNHRGDHDPLIEPRSWLKSWTRHQGGDVFIFRAENVQILP